MLSKYDVELNAVASGPTARKRTTENWVSFYRILARAKGGGGGGGAGTKYS